MAITVGTASGQFPGTIRHVTNGEAATETVFKRPSQDLEARTNALKAFVESEETRLTGHDHTGSTEGPQLTRASLSDVNVASGICGLDGNGVIGIEQIPAALLGDLKFKSTWDAATNTPTIPAAAPADNTTFGNQGQYYVVATAGSTSIDGQTDWKVGDWLVSNGTIWQKIDNTTEANLQLLNLLSFGAGTAGYAIAVKSDGTGYELADHGPRLTTLETASTNHDTRLTTIEGNTPVEETVTLGSASSTVTFTTLTWSTTNSVLDIEVYVNGISADVDQSHDGNAATAIAADFAKTGVASLKFAQALPANATVKVRRQGTFGGVDLQNIAVDVKPATNGAVSLGGTTQAFSAVHLKDTANGNVYKLQVTNGTLTVTLA